MPKITPLQQIRLSKGGRLTDGIGFAAFHSQSQRSLFTRTYQTVRKRNKPTETSSRKHIADSKTDTISNDRKLKTPATCNDRVLISSEIRQPLLQVQTPLHLPGKLHRREAVRVESPAKSNLLFVTDTATNRKFLVDTGSSVSLLPATEHEKEVNSHLTTC